MEAKTPLERERLLFQPSTPEIFKQDFGNLACKEYSSSDLAHDAEQISALFPNTSGSKMVQVAAGASSSERFTGNVGIILSGGPAPGGHNVIAGLFDGIQKINPESKVFGFLGGPSGILQDLKLELSNEVLKNYRNTGGFDLLGSGRTKLESDEDFATAFAVCEKHNIRGLIVVGGDDSNTNAALLAERAKAQGKDITVVGCPKTIDGDMRAKDNHVSFGFDSATKTYSELIGNIGRDANSARKYWHFIRLMGRSASHITLECALQTQPNLALISEEISEKKMTLAEIVDQIADMVSVRAEKGENFGLILVPEGLIEFIPEIHTLISKLNDILAHEEAKFHAADTSVEKVELMKSFLEGDLLATFSSLPKSIQLELLLDRDPHGNVQVSQIETEKMLIQMTSTRLKQCGFKGKFSAVNHFMGYEGRCGFPSNFDANYCYNLGLTASVLLSQGRTGYLVMIENLHKAVSEWQPGGIPTVMLMNMEQRHGSPKPVIKKALLNLHGKAFSHYAKLRETHRTETSFVSPGSIQFFGPSDVVDAITHTLRLENT